MQLENSFTVPVPVDEAWRVLLDIERIAPCMPGAALDSVTGDDIMALIRTLADEGVAVVLVTHEARHAAWADRVIFLRDGRLVDESQVVSDPMELLNDNPKRGRW